MRKLAMKHLYPTNRITLGHREYESRAGGTTWHVKRAVCGWWQVSGILRGTRYVKRMATLSDVERFLSGFTG